MTWKQSKNSFHATAGRFSVFQLGNGQWRAEDRQFSICETFDLLACAQAWCETRQPEAA